MPRSLPKAPVYPEQHRDLDPGIVTLESLLVDPYAMGLYVEIEAQHGLEIGSFKEKARQAEPSLGGK